MIRLWWRQWKLRRYAEKVARQCRELSEWYMAAYRRHRKDDETAQAEATLMLSRYWYQQSMRCTRTARKAARPLLSQNKGGDA